MEFGLKVHLQKAYIYIYMQVSILVLMEFGLKVGKQGRGLMPLPCFNPCFNGIWFKRRVGTQKKLMLFCFNPCFNGIWFKSLLL